MANDKPWEFPTRRLISHIQLPDYQHHQAAASFMFFNLLLIWASSNIYPRHYLYELLVTGCAGCLVDFADLILHPLSVLDEGFYLYGIQVKLCNFV